MASVEENFSGWYDWPGHRIIPGAQELPHTGRSQVCRQAPVKHIVLSLFQPRGHIPSEFVSAIMARVWIAIRIHILLMIEISCLVAFVDWTL